LASVLTVGHHLEIAVLETSGDGFETSERDAGCGCLAIDGDRDRSCLETVGGHDNVIPANRDVGMTCSGENPPEPLQVLGR